MPRRAAGHIDTSGKPCPGLAWPGPGWSLFPAILEEHGPKGRAALIPDALTWAARLAPRPGRFGLVRRPAPRGTAESGNLGPIIKLFIFVIDGVRAKRSRPAPPTRAAQRGPRPRVPCTVAVQGVPLSGRTGGRVEWQKFGKKLAFVPMSLLFRHEVAFALLQVIFSQNRYNSHRYVQGIIKIKSH